MDLSTLDYIRDSAINSGIGNSGLTSQAIQRANIEELHNLRAAISESSAIRENQVDEQKYKLAQEFVKNPLTATPQKSTVLDPTKIITLSGDSSGKGERLVSVGIPGQTYTPSFQTYDEAVKYLNKLNLGSTIVTTNPFLNDPIARQRLEAQGVKFLSRQEYQNLKGKPSAIVNPGAGGYYKLPKEGKSPSDKQMENLSNKPEAFNIEQIEPNMQAKLVSSYYDRLQLSAKKGNVSAMSQLDVLKGALAVGKGRQLVQAAVRSGYYNA